VTTSGSSGLHGVHKRLTPDLPLIPCGECEKKIVLEYRVKEGANKGRIFYTCQDHNVSCFFCHVCLCFAAIFVMILINGLLIWCSNFSGMALDHVAIDTVRKSMLRMSKSILRSRRLRQLRRLMRLHVSMMMRQLASRRSPSMICLF
jgi:hypothetical protein